MDEVQLMGSGLTTSLQLQAWHDDIALRNRDFNQPNTKLPPLVLPTHSWWMSATAAEHWFKKSVAMRMRISELWENRLCADPRTDAKDLFEIPKILHRCAVRVPTPPTEGNEKWQQYAWRLANHLASGENRAGKNKASDAEETEDILILVVCNTVDRAVAVYEALAKLTKGSSNERLYDEFHLFLLHSRFRGNERRGWSEKFKALERGEGHYAGGPRIMVTTQVIEAGVDISAALLYTELCPLASLIQRLGRCARRAGESGKAFWIDFEALRTEPSGELSDLTEEEKYAARPYDPAEIVAARNALIRRDNGVPSIPQANPR